MKKTILAFFLLLCLRSQASNVSSLSYSGTNVTTAAYVTVVASSPIPSNHILICDTSGVVLKIATGGAGSEVDLTSVPISACVEYAFGFTIPAGTRFSLKAISATANTGYSTVSFLP